MKPVPVWYVPAPQLAHTDRPATDPYVPATHRVQTLAPEPE